jgi:hypothetical protein
MMFLLFPTQVGQHLDAFSDRQSAQPGRPGDVCQRRVARPGNLSLLRSPAARALARPRILKSHEILNPDTSDGFI